MTMQLIETKTLTNAATSIEFTSIPQDGSDLLLLYSPHGVFANLGVRFNGSTSGYTFRLLGNWAGTSATYTNADFSLSAVFAGYVGPNPTPTNNSLYIPNYTGNANKSCSLDVVHEANSTTTYSAICNALWNNTAAITSLTLLAYTASALDANTVVSLYKITKGSGGATVS
jgi:hypothetical protein